MVTTRALPCESLEQILDHLTDPGGLGEAENLFHQNWLVPMECTSEALGE